MKDKKEKNERKEKEMKLYDREVFEASFDLEVSDKMVEVYDVVDGDFSYMKDEFIEALYFYDGDVYAKEVIFKEASKGQYKVDVTFYNFSDRRFTEKGIINGIKRAIADKDHSVANIIVH